MKKQGYGRIAFCSSIATGVPFFAIGYLRSLEAVILCVQLLEGFLALTTLLQSCITRLMHWIAKQYGKKGIVGVHRGNSPASHVEMVLP